jgi:hypothetical protein
MRAKRKKLPELDKAVRALKRFAPGELRKALAEHLITHCEHGSPRTQHCPWCYIKTPAYKQSLADAMWTVLD